MDFIIIIIYQDWKTSLLTMLTNSKLSFFFNFRWICSRSVPDGCVAKVKPDWSDVSNTSPSVSYLPLSWEGEETPKIYFDK